MSTLSPERAATIGRIGALILHSRHNSKDITSKARQAFLSKFERDVDPDGKLEPEERARRAGFARKAHFARLALRSAEVRKTKRSASDKEVCDGK